MTYDMSDFHVEALPLNEIETASTDSAHSALRFIPDPWMIRAYFENPKALTSKISKLTATYVKEHPHIKRAYEEDQRRSQAQDDALRVLFASR